MKLGSTLSVGITGLVGTVVNVEAHVAPGLPAFTISGLPDAACAQSPSRVRAAAIVAGHPLPSDRVTVNLSPSALPKRGSGFDLPIACAVLAAQDVIPAATTARTVHLGELGLDGMAYERFKRALALDPADPYVLATAGNGIAAFDDPDAERALRAAAVTAPQLPLARMMYGAYLSREGLMAAVEASAGNSDSFCNACFGGEYPVPFEKDVVKDENER